MTSQKMKIMIKRSLCRAIYGKPLHKRPQLGEIPDYVKE